MTNKGQKDYYKILGITDEEKKLQGDEFINVVRKKFKDLAKKWHPDRCRDDNKKAEYEEKFKEIAEANEVLSDVEKRQQYDNPFSGFSFDGFGGRNPFDLSGFGFDPFEHFGFGSRHRQNRTPQGQNIRINLPLTLEEIYQGAEKTIKYKVLETCPDCNGTCMGKNSKLEKCPHCGGSGSMFQQNGMMQIITTCPHCGGQGQKIINPCVKCSGQGVVQASKTTTIQIPKGVEEGSVLTVQGGGNAPIGFNGIPGDLLVVTIESEHDKFMRRGNDLYFALQVPVVDAILGSEIEVETIDKKRLISNIKPNTTPGTFIKFAGKGMPIYGTNQYGDMVGVVAFKMPEKLNDDEIQLLNELKEKENFKNC